MIGRVRSYIPAVGGGVIQAETGEEFRFSVGTGDTDLQGGDIVDFEPGGNGRFWAVNVTLRQRWATILNEKHRPLVNQFHKTVEIHA